MTDAAAIREKFLTTGCPKLDAILKGGILCRGITQIYGAASTGKTQLALQLCLSVQLPVTAGGLGADNNRKNNNMPTREISQITNKSLLFCLELDMIDHLNLNP